MTILSSPHDDSGGYPRRRRPLRAEITAERDRIKLEKLRKKVRRQWKTLGLRFRRYSWSRRRSVVGLRITSASIHTWSVI